MIINLLLPIFLLFNHLSNSESYVETEGAELYCQTMGQGPPLIVLHGGPGLSQAYLLPQMKELSRDHLVIFYDQRGSGKSKGPIVASDLSVERFVEDLESVRKHFGLKKFSLLGHSWGGFLGMNYAIRYPDRLEKLILSNSMSANREGVQLFIEEVMRRLAPFEKEITLIHEDPGFATGDPKLVERLHRIIFGSYCFDSTKADELSLYTTPEGNIRGSTVNEIMREKVFMNPFDLFPRLKELDVQTIVIHGDSDPIPHSTAKKIAEAIPKARFVLLQDCGHFPYVEDPKSYFKALREFLR